MANRFPLIFNSGAGQIQELAASDNLDLTSSNLVNAGILFTSSGSATAPSLQIGSGTTYNPGLYSPGTDQLAISTNGTGRLFVDATGNVGIGTSSPTSINNGAVVEIRNTKTTGTQADNQDFIVKSDNRFSIISVIGKSTGGSNIDFGDENDSNVGGIQYNHPSNYMLLYTNNNEAARIRSDGMFEVKGAGVAGSSPAFSVNGSAPANSAVIDTSGRLLVGTSSAPSFTSGVRLVPNGTSEFLTSGNDNVPLRVGSVNDIALDLILFHGASATAGGSISMTSATSVAYNTSSDYRLKENVTSTIDGIIRLQQLKPKRFNFIGDPNRIFDGFLAHEVQEIVPEAIHGTKDEVDADGSPVYQGIDQSKLVPLLTAALQEAIAKIESLEARLTAAGI